MTKDDIKQPTSSPRPIIFLDIDGVLNCTKHNKQIHFEATHLERLKTIIETTNALIVLSTFWRHFHEYITYVFHRHGIDVASCMLPLPMGATRGKQTTKTFLHYHRLKQEGDDSSEEQSMIGRSADDDAEYSSRAEEIEAWLQTYGKNYLGSGWETIEEEEDESNRYDWHNEDWKYVILDDRPSAAKLDTPLFDRFVHTKTEEGITEDEANWAIELLLSGPKDASTHRIPSLKVNSLDEIFSHEQCSISPDLAVLLTPENSPTKSISNHNSSPKQQEKNRPKQESPNKNAGNDTDESLIPSHYQQYESEVLAAMCDYSNVCPTLVALMQPPMDDNDDYCLSPAMMKSFEEEKKTSFDDTKNELKHDDDDDDTEETDCNAQPDQVGPSFDNLTDNIQNPPIPADSSPPKSIFNKFSPTFYEHNDDEEDNNDIGIDDLGQRWKMSSLSAAARAVGAPPLNDNK